MDYDSKDIINIVTVDKRETDRNSVRMEKECFIRTMDQLLTEIPLKEICTDAHVQIKALMSETWLQFDIEVTQLHLIQVNNIQCLLLPFADPERGMYKDKGVMHSLDMWHGGKSLAKRVHAVRVNMKIISLRIILILYISKY